MPIPAKVIQIFLSSPGDVVEHRDVIARAIQSWNQRNGRQRKIFFNVLRWEDFVSPDRSESAQEVINEQVGEDYDIFLGVMWAKFGTPTDNAGSGTEEEFQRALVRAKSGESVVLSFLFCTKDVPISSLDAEQYGGVQKFKKDIQGEGCLTRDFVDEATLLNAVNLILDRFANDSEQTSNSIDDDAAPKAKKSKGSPKDLASEASIANTSVADNSVKLEPELSDDGEEGLFDLSERFELETSNFVNVLSEWGQKLEELGTDMEETTDELAIASAMGKPDNKVVRPIIDRMATKMLVFSGWSKKAISGVEDMIDNLSKTSLKLIDISRDLNEPVDDLISARNSIDTLSGHVHEANEGIGSFVETLKSTPKLTRPMNKGITDIVDTHNRLIEKNRIFDENMQLCSSDLSDRIEHLEKKSNRL